MRDTDREQIERGIASIGYFDIDNCTCDPSVGVYPCHYCAEREAILAGQRVLERLAAASAALKAVDDAIAYWGVERGQVTLERIETALNKYEAAKGGQDADSHRADS